MPSCGLVKTILIRKWDYSGRVSRRCFAIFLNSALTVPVYVLLLKASQVTDGVAPWVVGLNVTVTPLTVGEYAVVQLRAVQV